MDVRSLALGNAVTADPPGISAIHFNPAALTRIEGLQTDVQGLIANFDIQREFSAPAGYNVLVIPTTHWCVTMGQKSHRTCVPTLKVRFAAMLNMPVFTCLF